MNYKYRSLYLLFLLPILEASLTASTLLCLLSNDVADSRAVSINENGKRKSKKYRKYDMVKNQYNIMQLKN